MLDGAALGKATEAHGDNIEIALREYEEAMFARSATGAVEAANTFKLCFQDDNVPGGLIELFTGGSVPTSNQ